MQDQAREIFIAMVRDCGEDIVRMRASFEMYLGQYLVDFPEERQLMLDAYKVGIPAKLMQHAGEKDYDQYLSKLVPRFAEAAKRPEDESAWGVRLWAEALGRTAEYTAPLPQEVLYPEDLLVAESKAKKIAASTMMTIIVTAGGVLGAGLASLVWPLAMYAAGFSARIYAGDLESGSSLKTDYDRKVYFFLTFLTAGIVGGLGALAGWLFGRGDSFPWAGFCVAFGTGMTMLFIIMVIPVPFIPSIVWRPIVLFGSVFGTVYKTAARGGDY